MTMKSQGKIVYTFLIVVFFSGSLFSQDQILKFKDQIDFNVLDNFIKKANNDSLFVSNSNFYTTDNSKDFYFYNSKTKQKLFPYGFEMTYPFVGKSAVVKYKDRWGLIDRNGAFIFYSEFTYPIKLTSYEKYAVFDGNIKYDVKNGAFRESSINCALPATPDYFITKKQNGKYDLLGRNRQSVFKAEMDFIISKQELMYEDSPSQNLLIVQKKNKYGVYLANGSEILKIKYEKAKFVGNYIMIFENNAWNYYTYENNTLNLILSSPFECVTPAYQAKVIGPFKKDNQYNLLKINGETLPDNFDYINENATYGVKDNALFIFDMYGNYYPYAEK